MKQKKMTTVRRSFRVIQVLVGLMLLFLVVQGAVQWKVSREGVESMARLEKEGLPGLADMAALEANINLFRLRSYEMMFVAEDQREKKLQQVDQLHTEQGEILARLIDLIPDPAGAALLADLSSSLNAYVDLATRIRTEMNEDFAVAMELLDKEEPVAVQHLIDTKAKVKNYCTDFAAARTAQSVAAFQSTKKTVLAMGSSSVGFAATVLIFVTLSSGRIRRSLTELAGRLAQGSEQTTESAGAVAGASQGLADGSSDQAASLEETSASLEEMTSMVNRNADSAQQAKDLSTQTSAAADTGAKDVEEMQTSMSDIKESSDEVAKIVKNIDEIAFQTNILALNAAVEAARAGEAGMGFAVVAEEVRNLAQRSAQAARETSTRIKDAIDKTGRGVEVSGRVAVSLKEIIEKARTVDGLVGEIAVACREQAEGISQLNGAVTQMDRVTQSNAATAEECASAAKELDSQATAQKTAVDELLALVGSGVPESRKEKREVSSETTARKEASDPESDLDELPMPDDQPRHRSAKTPSRSVNNAELEDDFRDF